MSREDGHDHEHERDERPDSAAGDDGTHEAGANSLGALESPLHRRP
jgi:hypothetical protein